MTRKFLVEITTPAWSFPDERAIAAALRADITTATSVKVLSAPEPHANTKPPKT
jgi:hypothetical protein